MSDLITHHLDWLEAGGASWDTVYNRERVLSRADAETPYGLTDADHHELTSWFAGRDWSKATRSNYWMHVNAFYVWAVPKYLTLNPMLELNRPPHPRQIPNPVTDDELARAIDLSPDQPWRMMTVLAAYAGLRCSEAAAILREDVTEDVVRVRHGKGDQVGVVPTSPELWEYVKDRPKGHLVIGARGRPVRGRTLTQEQHKHWTRLGMPDVHWHRFRHWFATYLLRHGADLRTVQELMRHRSILSTQGYTQVVDVQRRAAVNLLPRIGGHEPESSRLVPPATEAA